ncbi:hypothetical protein BK133_17410 [Paenibacillus sp. FSL H8-0548]|uniref:serine hydrolase domain-containing protein n=1 Tax=Paenibacillus sp. FSL H8-0548 TaxID=1920422 RepID=UPI00096DEF10|nr:serine hydrolase domain-containing protein [Paenibacillus sp. FSL H8-0548]OMF29777.1 hypothetical protein BK133_17410 [Paenibacillus sp. FSL H8-0548]
MSVLFYTIAAALTSYGVAPEKAHAAESDTAGTEYTKIDRYMQSAMEKLDIPGAALGIVHKDGPLYIKGYGTADSKNSQITPQTPFIIGSMSKSFTAMAVMQLVDSGKIELNAPVQRYLPEFRVADEKASEAMTVRSLLNQTSGIPTIAGLKLPAPELKLELYPAAQLRTKLSEPAGSLFQYSNANYNVLGALVQAVSGQPYGEYMKSHIFEPLGMKNTAASYVEAVKLGLSDGHQSLFGWMITTSPKERPADIPSGYIKASAEDMTRYLIAQMNGGAFAGKQVVSTQSIALMQGEQGVLIEDDRYYGMGWMKRGNSISHDGGVENFQSNMLIDGDIGIVILLNKNDAFVFGAEVMTEGVRAIMDGQEPSLEELPTASGGSWAMRIIGLLIILFVIRSIYVAAAWNKVFKYTHISITLQAVSIGLFHLIIPVFILFVLPTLLQTPWQLMFAMIPGISQLVYMASITLLAFGTAKLMLLFKSISLKKV